jgi:uncharacterized membrane protein
MKSRLQLAGHPIHAMIVGFPMGLYSVALVTDGLYLLLGDAFWFQTTFWMVAFGLVSHLGAAVSGVPDYLALRRDPAEAASRRPALAHLVLGLGLLVVQLLNLALRNLGNVPDGSVALPVLTNLVAVSLTGLQGWYGGELVYRHHIGIERP